MQNVFGISWRRSAFLFLLAILWHSIVTTLAAPTPSKKLGESQVAPPASSGLPEERIIDSETAPPSTTDPMKEALDLLVENLSEVITHDPPPLLVFFRVPPPRLAGRLIVERYRAERARAAKRFRSTINFLYPNNRIELTDDGEYFIKEKVQMSSLRLLWLISDDSSPYSWDAITWYAYGNPVAEKLYKCLLNFKSVLESLPEENLKLSLFRDFIKALSALEELAELGEKSVDRQRDVMRFLDRARIQRPTL